MLLEEALFQLAQGAGILQIPGSELQSLLQARQRAHQVVLMLIFLRGPISQRRGFGIGMRRRGRLRRHTARHHHDA